MRRPQPSRSSVFQCLASAANPSLAVGTSQNAATLAGLGGLLERLGSTAERSFIGTLRHLLDWNHAERGQGMSSLTSCDPESRCVATEQADTEAACLRLLRNLRGRRL
jgi:hypothetical protein